MEPRGRVLVVGGSDSSGGAGVEADVKTVAALGGYASTTVTALTAQNTLGIHGEVPIDPAFVELSMQVVLEDVGADAIKTGMLHSRGTVEAVARAVRRVGRPIPLVVDPVMVSSSGTSLLSADARVAMAKQLFPMATLVTPNAPEAKAITGVVIDGIEAMQHAADRILLMGPEAVLIKGGHLSSDVVVDLLRTADGLERRFESPRITGRPVHGTGCTLASAIAVGLAEGMTLEGAVQEARKYVVGAITRALPYGEGLALLNHLVDDAD